MIRESKHLMKSFARLIDECKSINELKQIHTQIITSATIPNDNFLISRLLFFFAVNDSGCLSYATAIFELIENPNLFIYNAIIRAHARRSSSKTLLLYKRMLRSGVRPNKLTFPFLLKKCMRPLDHSAGPSVHTHIFKVGFENDVFVQNAIISVYAGSGLLDCAHRVFDEMPERDIVSWNSILIGCLRCGALDSALDIFLAMKERNVITWNSIITGFVQGGRPKEALAFFHEMQVSDDGSGVRPDKITTASVLSACASLGALDHGKWVHNYLKRNELEFDVVIATALVDMYGKCGCVERAAEAFELIPNKDISAWSAMISAFAINGLANEAFKLLGEMESSPTRPNNVTFVALLSACAHAGLVEKGRWCFDLMSRVYSIEPQVEHYGCMVDLLSRARLFEEAEELIGKMPMEADVFVWGALLGGCRMHGNVELGERVAKHLIKLEPLNHAFYITLSDIYAKASRFDDLKRVRAFMKERGITKTAPGCSMIEIDGVVHEFSVQGSQEDVMKEIEWVLNGISDAL